MALITNGTVTYERRVKTGDFEHKQAAITIHYALDQGEDLKIADLLIASAGQLATQHVFGMLRAKPGTGNDAGNGGTNGSQPAVEQTVRATNGSAPRDAGDRTGSGVSSDRIGNGVSDSTETPPSEVAEIDIGPAPAPVTNLKAAKRAAAAKAKEIPPPPFATAVNEADVIAMSGEIIPPASPPAGSATPAPVGDVIDVDDFTAVAPAPTDAELGQALSRVNAKLKDRPRIMALIGEFVASGESYTKIPDVRRSEFLTRLNALV